VSFHWMEGPGSEGLMTTSNIAGSWNAHGTNGLLVPKTQPFPPGKGKRLDESAMRQNRFNRGPQGCVLVVAKLLIVVPLESLTTLPCGSCMMVETGRL
jgi:hypothetical protein